MELRKQLCVDCCCPPVVSMLYTTKSNRKECSLLGFVLLRVKRDPGWSWPTHKAKCVGFSVQKGEKPWERFQGKHILKSNWITGQICIIQITRRIGQIPTITQIRRSRAVSPTKRFTTRAADIKPRFGLTGHPTIRNTTIKWLEESSMPRHFFDYDDGDFCDEHLR